MRDKRKKQLNAKAHASGIKRISKNVKTKLQSADQAQKKADGKGRRTLMNYAGCINRMGQWYGLKVHRPPNSKGWPVIVVSNSCRMTDEQVKAVINLPLNERGTHLSVRNPRALGILDHESYEVRLDNPHGPLVLVHVRNAFSTNIALNGSDSFEKVHRHKHSNEGGWCRGCEAEPRFRSNVILGQVKDDKMMKSWGFKASNMEKIMSVGPKKPDIDMKSKIKYKSNHTGRIIEQPLGMQ